MEALEAYALTGNYRAATESAGCDHHTVVRYVKLREVGRAPDNASTSPDRSAPVCSGYALRPQCAGHTQPARKEVESTTRRAAF